MIMTEDDILADMKPEMIACLAKYLYQINLHPNLTFKNHGIQAYIALCWILGKDVLAELVCEIQESMILVEKRDFLCQNLNPKVHYPYLRSSYILSEDDQEVIDSAVTRREKVSKFLDILMKKGRNGFDELINSILQERTQVFLAKELNKAYEDKVKRVKSLLSNQDLINQKDHGNEQKTSVVYTMEKLLHPNVTQSQYRHSYPEDKCCKVTSTSTNRDSISDLGVDTDKLPKPVKVKPGFVEIKTDYGDDIFKSCPEVLTYREHSLEEHEDRSSTSSS